VGDLEEILKLRREGGRLDVREEAIGYEVEETTRFEVKRPDRDGSLNWP
jgi:hypothetical protein